MNASEIIKSIEAEQLKAEVPEFRVGDTVKALDFSVKAW
jgi:large subunit ribosomal protein L19